MTLKRQPSVAEKLKITRLQKTLAHPGGVFRTQAGSFHAPRLYHIGGADVPINGRHPAIQPLTYSSLRAHMHRHHDKNGKLPEHQSIKRFDIAHVNGERQIVPLRSCRLLVPVKEEVLETTGRRFSDGPDSPDSLAAFINLSDTATWLHQIANDAAAKATAAQAKVNDSPKSGKFQLLVATHGLTFAAGLLVVAALMIVQYLITANGALITQFVQDSKQPLSLALIFVASYLAGSINSVASGGTILTFSTLVALGIPPLVANATNTVALVPGSIAAAYGFRGKFRNAVKTTLILTVPTVIGGILGANLVIRGGDALFARITPWLILGSTGLFVMQERTAYRKAQQREKLMREQEAALSASTSSSAVYAHTGPAPSQLSKAVKIWLVAVPAMLLISVYGGYFGPGMGFLTLAVLAMLGMTNIHQMLGVKNVISALINLSAGVIFVAAGRVDWLLTGLMLVGVVIGAASGANIAVKLGQSKVRKIIIGIGLMVTVWLFLRH